MQRETQASSKLTILGSVVTSGLIWLGIGLLNKTLLAATTVTTGIELVYLPAGFRLLIILVFGFWGALGIFLTNPFLFVAHFGTASAAEIILNAAISAFVPFVVVSACSRYAGIDASLMRLRPIHLPILALAVSVVTPLVFNLQFAAFGRDPPDRLLENFVAMSLGDFLGCFIVIASARLLIAAYRAAT